MFTSLGFQNFQTEPHPYMPEEIPRQNFKEFRYNSPSKQSMLTPTKKALISSNYKVGPFLEKMNELNIIKQKLKNAELNQKRKEGSENDAHSVL